MLLEVGSLPPDRLLLREDVECVRVDRPGGRNHALVGHRLGVVHPDGLSVLLVDVEVNRRLDDRLRGDGTALLLSALGLGEPLFA